MIHFFEGVLFGAIVSGAVFYILAKIIAASIN